MRAWLRASADAVASTMKEASHTQSNACEKEARAVTCHIAGSSHWHPSHRCLRSFFLEKGGRPLPLSSTGQIDRISSYVVHLQVCMPFGKKHIPIQDLVRKSDLRVSSGAQCRGCVKSHLPCFASSAEELQQKAAAVQGQFVELQTP
eukprot:365881-Chlamydomonas_euryale.AAC.9